MDEHADLIKRNIHKRQQTNAIQLAMIRTLQIARAMNE